jgi:peptidoglycan/xylan/chitin deacetylase (PgdA/CDA1 family)
MDRIISNIVNIPPLDSLALKLFGHYVTIFMLHRPTPANGIYNGTCPKLLERCLSYAEKKNFQFANIDDIVTMALSGTEPERPIVCFTMDDGYLDQLTVLTPVLLKFGAKPTIFVLSDFSDKMDWPWDAKLIYMAQATAISKSLFTFEQFNFELDFTGQQERIISRRKLTSIAKYLPDNKQDEFIDSLQKHLQVQLPKTAPADFAPADWDSLRYYHDLGLNVGAHGKTHKIFNSLSDEKITQELLSCKERLFSEIPDASNVFCYSSGTDSDYSAEHCPLVAKAKYIAAVSAKPGNTSLGTIRSDLFNIKRHSFPAKYDQFIRYTSWFELLRTKMT